MFKPNDSHTRARGRGRDLALLDSGHVEASVDRLSLSAVDTSPGRLRAQGKPGDATVGLQDFVLLKECLEDRLHLFFALSLSFALVPRSELLRVVGIEGLSIFLAVHELAQSLGVVEQLLKLCGALRDCRGYHLGCLLLCASQRCFELLSVGGGRP